MSGICGIFGRAGNPVSGSAIETMRKAMAEWGPDGSEVLRDGSVGMGQMRLFSTPESRHERMPLIDNARGVVFTAAGRVDNREELLGKLPVSGKQAGISDGELMLHAYLEWGEDCPGHILGDWALASYHQEERRLFLARDHHGNASLYYYADPRVFAFASSRKALLALNLALRMDELYLAQVLVSWLAYHGERTIHSPIKRLPPGHCLAVTPEEMDIHRYWRLEDTPELLLPRREDYPEAFKVIFDEAVRCRLRSAGDIAATLSGGLDSGSVAATAARLLRGTNTRLFAFTAVPLSETREYVRNGFGDEFPLARATAEHAGNIDLCRVTAEYITPIQAIRLALDSHSEPGHGAANSFWLQELMEAARKNRCPVLLTGQMGNGGVSWPGDASSQSTGFQLRRLGWRRWSKDRAKRYAPALVNAYRKMRRPKNGWWASSAIHPDFASRLNLRDRMLSAPDSPLTPWPLIPRERRCLVLRPGQSFGGAWWHESSAAFGLEVRDPTADARVLAFALSVPDHIFRDPETGLDRWLIREAMKGRLPDEVRLNRTRGRQSADLVPRLRASAHEVETALDELKRGPAAAYVNVPYMREVWAMVRTHDTPEAFHKSVTVLTRGIMAGLWVNDFYNAS